MVNFLEIQFGADREINLKERQLKTKEEVIMFAAAMLYAQNEEFPYEIKLSEELVRTDIADISHMVIRKCADK